MTFVTVRPFTTALATLPCCEAPQIGVASPPRPWLSALNHWQTSATRIRFGAALMPAPMLARKRLSGFFSFATESKSRQSSTVRSLYWPQYSADFGFASLRQTSQWQTGRPSSGGHAFVNSPSMS